MRLLTRIASYLRRPPIHEQFAAGDEAGVVRGEEQGRGGDFFRAAHAGLRDHGDAWIAHRLRVRLEEKAVR